MNVASWDDPGELRGVLDRHVQGSQGWCVECGVRSVSLRVWPCGPRSVALDRLATLERARPGVDKTTFWV